MKVAGVRMRTSALAYVVFEDALIIGLLLGAFAFAHFGNVLFLHSPLGLVQAVVFLTCVKAAFFLCGLYDFRHLLPRSVFWGRLLGGIAFVTVGVWLFCLATHGGSIAYSAFLITFVPAILVSRLTYDLLTSVPGFRCRLLFMGIGEQALRTARQILDERSRDYDVVGFLAEHEDETAWRIGKRPVLGTYSDLERVVEDHKIHRVVVAVADRRKQMPLEALLRVRLEGIEVVEEAKVHEEITGKIPVEDLRPSWLIFSEGFTRTGLRDLTKRLFDIVIASVGLVLSAPLAVLTAIAVRLGTPGPVLFKQTRIGQGGREFTLYKFRSMRQDAEASGTPQWAQKDDPRVTRVGRIIRKTRLDEIPQLWNVLMGTMSLVGPRPERPFFVEELRKRIPFYDQRHAVKPGITGWAQVRFTYAADESDSVEKLRHDMFYIKHHSVLFDLRILLETVRVVFQQNKGW